MERIRVAEVMTRDPITIKPETSLLDCAKIMVKKRVGTLLLVNGKKLIGLISRKDILWALIKKSKQDLSKIKAVDISPKKIATVKPDSTIREALNKMKQVKFERLPVIFGGNLVGMLTARDILSVHPEAYPELEEFTHIREESEKLRRIKKIKDTTEGICEECGNFDILFRVNDSLICENCREKI
ncbi:MAG: CBS domain-containing protein [Nanoarchaeota archaeon]